MSRRQEWTYAGSETYIPPAAPVTIAVAFDISHTNSQPFASAKKSWMPKLSSELQIATGFPPKRFMGLSPMTLENDSERVASHNGYVSQQLPGKISVTQSSSSYESVSSGHSIESRLARIPISRTRTLAFPMLRLPKLRPRRRAWQVKSDLRPFYFLDEVGNLSVSWVRATEHSIDPRSSCSFWSLWSRFYRGFVGPLSFTCQGRSC